jgi:hypothetical protein
MKTSHATVPLKGHGNEADFLGFLQKFIPHRSLTLLFKPFRFWHELAEIFVIEKRLAESATPRLGEPGSHYGVAIRIF